ncbi:hypothetical protein [Streptomyces sp. AM 2-1-1]|uniref:hypothetical protein n=1 Tax=Streptomyces sp. AM 2-1-1 TaxID=3028709 RepID=UPI0023B97AD3|nr:hypothetical protein [Streptomyces sp. AM 2-1-1]WEH41612.1 hypothetical protein PZB77_20090 [Streptomyces sp. AM 2-1-1]
MPRPTAAQLVYGCATVVLVTLVLLLVSGASSAAAVGVVCLAALAAGVLVAVTVPTPHRARGPVPAGATRPYRTPSRSSREGAAGEERVGGPARR